MAKAAAVTGWHPDPNGGSGWYWSGGGKPTGQAPVNVAAADLHPYAYGQDPGASAGTSTPTKPGSPTVNTAQNQPDAQWAVDQLKARAGGDMGAGRAIDIAGQKIREAAIGGGRALEAGVAERVGGSGGGLGDRARAGYEAGTQRSIAGAAADIAEGREDKRDTVLNSIVSGGLGVGQLNQGDRRLALDTQTAEDANRRAEEAAADARLKSILDELSATQSIASTPVPPTQVGAGTGSYGSYNPFTGINRPHIG